MRGRVDRSRRQHFALGWHQVKEIDKQQLLLQLRPADLSGITQIALDEFAIHKSQSSAKVEGVDCPRFA